MPILYNKDRKNGLFYIPSGGLGPSVSADFSYSKSSFNQGEADPTPTITGTAGGSFNADAGVVFVDTGSFNSSTGQIDLSATSIGSHIITYTVDGVQSGQTVGVTAAPFINQYSFLYDGFDEYLSVNPILKNLSSDNFTISTWVKINSLPTGTAEQVIFQELTSASRYVRLCTKGNQNGFVLRYGNFNNLQINGSTTITTGVWYHLSLVYSTTGIKLYVDGNEDASATYTALSRGAFAYAAIGCYYFAGTAVNFWNGYIDEFSIWDSALSTDAITEIASGPNNLDSLTHASSTDLISWYRMGDEATFSNPGGVGNWTLVNQGSGGNNAISVNMEETDRVTETP